MDVIITISHGQVELEARPSVSKVGSVTLMVTPTVKFPSECGRILVHKVLVSFGNTIRV